MRYMKWWTICPTLCLLFFLRSDAIGLTINHDTGIVSWSDGTETWSYALSSSNWSWDNGSATWSYNNSTKKWVDNGTLHGWQHDATHDVWVSIAGGAAYDVTPEFSFNAHVWHYDASTKKWAPMQRSFMPLLAFNEIENLSWQYDATVNKWVFARTIASENPDVVSAKEWRCMTSNLSWLQYPSLAGELWSYNRSNQKFTEATESKEWSFLSRNNNEELWEISGEESVGFGSWDRVQWRHKIANGQWTSEELRDDPLVYGLITRYAYDAGSQRWYTDSNLDGHPEIVGDGKLLFPLFPPTPFAQQKGVIESAVLPLLTNGPEWGSVDGSGAGVIDVLSDSFITNGRFVFDVINRLSLKKTVTLSGDLEFVVKNDASITLGEDTGGSETIIKPAAGADHAQLIFNVDRGKTLTIFVHNDVSFYGTDIPLFLTFRGAGTTCFRVPSGKTITFGPANRETGTEGVRLQVVMEMLKSDIDAFKNQLVFAPWSYAQESGDGAIDSDQRKSTFITFDRHSSLSFISENEAGVNESEYPGYGAIAFDVAREGVGRTIVNLARGKVAGDAIDAGINIYGNLVLAAGNELVPADFRTGVYKHKRAGIRALFRVIDSLAFSTIVPDVSSPTLQQAQNWLARDSIHRRGLVVLNHNNTYPKLLANLERAATLQESAWAQHAQPYHPGFIIGNNGQVDVWHNLFFDYIGGSSNQVISPEPLAGSGATLATVKKRNPSALIIDGFGSYAASSERSWDMEYEGANAPYHTHALITLQGSAGFFVRCGASAETKAMLYDIQSLSSSGIELVDGTIGTGAYNGVCVPVLSSFGSSSVHESIATNLLGNPYLSDGNGVRCLDGEYALDIEGALAIKSVLGRFGFPPNGYVNIPSLRIDHTGAEFAGGQG